MEFRNEQVVLVDWTTFKSSGDFWKQDIDSEDQKWASEVTMTHRNTGMSLTMNIEHKGSDGVPDVTPEGYTVTVGLDFMRRLCLRECFLQTDGEPAADDFAKRLKAARKEKNPSTWNSKTFFSKPGICGIQE